MAISFPRFDRYTPNRTLRTNGGGEHGCEIFEARGKPKTDSKLLIGVLHGWLGAGTMRYVADAAREHGHTVFVVNHSKSKHQERAKAVHEATKAAVEATRIQDVFYIGHSLAARDIVSAATYHQKKNPHYKIRRLATVDGVGTNGSNIDLLRVGMEIRGFLELLRDSPRTNAEIIGRSAVNLLRNPIAHAVEGVSTLKYDASEDIAKIRDAGVVVTNDFHLNDFVIRPPADSRGQIHEGGHMTFITSRETIDSVLRSAA